MKTGDRIKWKLEREERKRGVVPQAQKKNMTIKTKKKKKKIEINKNMKLNVEELYNNNMAKHVAVIENCTVHLVKVTINVLYESITYIAVDILTLFSLITSLKRQ